MNISILAVFIPTFLFVSLTPGMCMTLSMTLGMTIGLRRTFWMMYGELVGVGLVAASSVIGVATLMLQYPTVFTVGKYAGGLYLGWLGVQLWRSRGKMSLGHKSGAAADYSPRALAMQGFVTAVANPKGWAFFIALLPPFINDQQPLFTQLSLLLSMILSIEFLCLILYASGGRTLNHHLQKRGNVRFINRIAGSLMAGVGIWLGLS